jgi:phosphatidylglycerol:prolipoprotein diacylglycerol transferase
MLPTFESLRWPMPYGVMMVVACLVAAWLTRRRAAAVGEDVSHVDLALPLALLVGALGTRLLAVVAFDRLLLFALPLFAVPVLIAYCRVAGLSPARFFDCLAPPMLLWVALLRIGCFLAGCCWGDVSAGYGAIPDAMRAQVDTLPSVDRLLDFVAVQFPAGSFAAEQHASLGLIGGGSSLPVLPTQLIESIAAVCLYAGALRVERSLRTPGALAWWCLGGYAIVRFGIEFLRADNAVVWRDLTGNQFVCLGLIGAALIMTRLAARARPKTGARLEPPERHWSAGRADVSTCYTTWSPGSSCACTHDASKQAVLPRES